MQNFNDGNYSLAIDYFEKIDSYDETNKELYSSAKFHIGECLLALGQRDGAISNFETFITNYPTTNYSELALYRLGNLYFQKKMFEKSRKSFLDLVTNFPNSELTGTSYHFIGETFINEDDYLKAEKYFQLAVQTKSSSYFADYSLFSLANIQERKGDYLTAVENYDKLLGFYKNSKLAPQAQLRIGVCYFKLNEYDNAILELSDPLIEKLSVDDKNEADFILANSFFRLNEYKNASNTYKKILNNSPSNEMLDKIRYGLAWINFKEGNYESAYKFFTMLINSSNDSIAIKSFFYSGEAKRYEGKNNEAIEIHKQFSEKYPKHPLAELVKLNIGISKFSEDKLLESEETLLTSINSGDPLTKAKSYTLLGEINLRKKDYKQSSEYFKRGLMIIQSPVELKDRCNLGLGVANFFMGKNLEALNNLSNIEEITTLIDKNKLFFYKAEANFFLGDYQLAINNYNKILTEDRQLNKNVLYGKAYSYFNLKDFNKAAFLFNEYIAKFKSDERFDESELRLADSYFALKDFNKAVVHYKNVLENTNEFSQDERIYFNLAQSLYKSGNENDAIEKFKDIQLRFPLSDFADNSQYLIAWIYFQKGDFNSAILNYRELFDKYKNSTLLPIAQYSIGDSYFNLGNYDEAIKNYDYLIKNFPQSTYIYDAVIGIQYCYVVQDRINEAVSFLDNFISSNNNLDFLDKIQFKKAEIFYSAGDYSSAVSNYEKIIINYPQSSLINSAYYWMGKSEVNLNNFENALAHFEIVYNNDINSEEGFNSVLEAGKIYRSKRDFAREILLYNMSLTKITDIKKSAEINFAKAQSFFESDNIPAAYQTFNEIVNTPDISIFYYKAQIELGLIELSRLNYEKAVVYFEEVSTNRKDDLAAKANYFLGKTFFEQNKTDEAKNEFIKVRSLYSAYDEWYTKSLLALGDCYAKLNDKKNAAEMYKAVLQKHRRDQLGKEANEKLNSL